MAVRPACYIPSAAKPSTTDRLATLCKTLALWVFLWAVGLGAPLLVAAATGRL